MPVPRSLVAILAVVALSGCNEPYGPPVEVLQFTAPIEGTPMTDVFYGAYLDQSGGQGLRDYRCGSKTYPGHAGVDILLRNFREQDAGVAVLAAADGTVRTVVDGHPDRNTSWAGGGFGNHVVLQHVEGFTSVYAHLRNGSIPVAPGEHVARGAVLGLVGSSGTSNWPHLHFEVHNDGRIVDPFAGQCATWISLWEQQLPYQDAFLVADAGLTYEPGTFAALLERPPTLESVPADVDEFRYWLQVVNQASATMRHEFHPPGGGEPTTFQHQVGPTFSMRYVVVNVPVNGVLTAQGEWEIRTYQGPAHVWTQRFTIAPGAAAGAGISAGAADRAPRTFGAHVLDQAARGH